MTKRETLELLGLGGGLCHRATDRLRTIDVVEVDAVEAGVESRELLEELRERDAISGLSVRNQRAISAQSARNQRGHRLIAIVEPSRAPSHRGQTIAHLIQVCRVAAQLALTFRRGR